MMLVKAFISACLVFSLSVDVVQAAEPTASPSATPVELPELSPHWFVRFGVLAAINQSSSKLYSQSSVGVFGVGPELLLPGRGESFSNLLTVSIQAGYFVTPNWSVEIAGGIPVWQTARITGFSPTGPAAGTVLTKTVPGSVPITVIYHFTQFGALQPYVGGGIAPIFVFVERDGYATGTSTEASVGLILQGGFDYMLNRNWGVFFDAKKYFDRSIGKATGVNVGPPVGLLHVTASSVTNSQPWVFATGLTYRF